MKRTHLVLGGLLIGVAAMTVSTGAAVGDKSDMVTFNNDVLPVLQKSCQACHRPGEVAPMSLLTYADARPWARAMKNTVVNRQMPPWFVDGHSRPFANDKTLSEADIKTIARGSTGARSKATRRTSRRPSSFRTGGTSSPI